MTDGVSEEAPDTIMSVYRIAKEAKQIKDENNIKFVGALLSTTQRTPRIDELQSVVSEVNDAVDAVPSTATAEKVAKELAFRVKRWIRPGERSFTSWAEDLHCLEKSASASLTRAWNWVDRLRQIMREIGTN